MPPNNITGYYAPFPVSIPLYKVGCIRVTHPSAGRHHQVLLPNMLPLDLHVLCLPLAFILSQDQTLHCINSFSFFIFVLRYEYLFLRKMFYLSTQQKSVCLDLFINYIDKDFYFPYMCLLPFQEVTLHATLGFVFCFPSSIPMNSSPLTFPLSRSVSRDLRVQNY